MEKEPVINFTYGGIERQFRRDNTSLYTFIGHLALYNHVFTAFDAQEGQEQQGLYIYQAVLPEQYTRLEEFMVDNQYPQHLNMSEVSEMDQASLHKVLTKDLSSTDTIPDEWLD